MARVSALFPATETFKNTFTEEDIKRKIAIEKFIMQEFSDKTVISDEEGRRYYSNNLDDFTKPEQIMASHILVNVPVGMSPADKEAALAKITNLQQQLANGADFAELARENSEDSTAANGGALGYFMRGQMVPAFEKAAFAAEKDEVSDIVETEFGYHLIKVLDRKPLVIIAYEDISEKLKVYLKQQQVQKKVDAFIKEQREKADIEIILTK
jgi:peptidyl-prolyl cis-trans isomerase C